VLISRSCIYGIIQEVGTGNQTAHKIDDNQKRNHGKIFFQQMDRHRSDCKLLACTVFVASGCSIDNTIVVQDDTKSKAA
jgi:hypothetical protein